MSIEPQHRRERPAPLRWIDEQFWRDLFTNVIAFGITALLAYLFALSAGYVTDPDTLRVAITLGSMVAFLFIGRYGARFSFKWIQKKFGDKVMFRIYNGYLIFALIAAIGITAYNFRGLLGR